jgi:hypothetical protein
MQILYFIFIITNIHSADLYFIQNQNKKICANCKFFIPNKNECCKFGELNIITGEYSYELANSVRKDENKCGEYAIFFTPFNISNADFHSIKKILKNVKSTGVLTLTRLFLNADCLT